MLLGSARFKSARLAWSPCIYVCNIFLTNPVNLECCFQYNQTRSPFFN
jgi:hypothetical protein